jgi:hypothetical protein
MDAVFFLKAPAYGEGLPWPEQMSFIVLEPPKGASVSGDWRTSTAYSNLAAQLTAAGGGSAIAYLRRKHGIDGRIALMSFSAGFGFLDKILQNPMDLEQVSACLLLDSSFGGGKSGYVAFGQRAATGDALLVATTANTGGDDSWQPVWAQIAAGGFAEAEVEPAHTMPLPSGGVRRLGKLAFWYRFVDTAGRSELPHWEQHKLAVPVLESYLLPYWKGELAGRRGWASTAALVAAAVALGVLASRLA